MKKEIKYLGLLFILLLCFSTGCGKKDPEKILKDAIEKTENAKSTKVKFGLNYGFDMQGISIGVSFTGEEEVYKENNDMVSAHGTYDVKAIGMNQSIENYSVQKEGYLYSYIKDEDGQWSYTKTEYKQNNDYKDKIIKMIDSATKVKSEKSDKKGYNKLSVTLDIEDTLKSLNEIMPKDSLDEFSEQLNSFSMKEITFTVYIKDGYISVIEMDLEDILNNTTTLFGNEFGKIDVHGVLTISLFDYNKVSEVKVPDEVINNEKEKKKMDLDVKKFMNFDDINALDEKLDF